MTSGDQNGSGDLFLFRSAVAARIPEGGDRHLLTQGMPLEEADMGRHDLWQHAVWALGMALAMGWLARSRLRPRAREKLGVLEYPASVLGLGLVCTGLSVAFGILSLFGAKNEPRWIAFGLLGFTLLGISLTAESLRVRHHLEADGLRYTPLLNKPGSFRWCEVRRVRYSEMAKWFRIETSDGRIVRISAMLRDLPEFVQALLQGVPADYIDSKTLPVLERTADGYPPPIWHG